MFSLNQKNYEISEIQYTFDFISLVFKNNTGVDSAIIDVANKYNLNSDDLRNYLIENNFILNRTNKKELKKQIGKYNTKALKKILKKHGLKTSGKRKKIEQRIIDNKLIKRDYYLSYKSKLFYKNKQRRIRIFNEYLSDYYNFSQFNDFYMDNFRKKEAKIPIAFIEIHIAKSVDSENHENYIENNQIMAKHYFKKENFKKMLEYVLKIYCMNLNPIWKVDNLNQHDGLLFDTYDELIFLNTELSKNTIIHNYYLVWDSFDFNTVIVPKFEGYRILKDILNIKDFNKINSNLKEHFYNNKNLKIKKILQKTLFDF